MNFRSILSFHASINSSGAHALWANPLTLAFCKKKLQISPCGDKCGWGFRDEGCCLHNYYWEVTVTNVQANEELFRPTRVLLRFTPTPHPHPSFKLATSLRGDINNFSTCRRFSNCYKKSCYRYFVCWLCLQVCLSMCLSRLQIV